MNLSVSPASLRSSVAWPDAPSYRPPLHVDLALARANEILAAGEAEDRAATLAGIASNPARALVATALHMVECDLANLKSPATRVVFIGNVGVGKTTALCYMANLTRTEPDARAHRERRMKPVLASLARTIAELEAIIDRPLTTKEQIKLSASRAKLDADRSRLADPVGPTDADRILLPASAGRTTVCPMEISYAVEPSIEITPLPLATFVSLVKDAATEAFNLHHSAEPAAESSVAKEIVRAIRNMAGLSRREFEDLARSSSDPAALLRDLLLRIDYPGRTTTFCEPDSYENPEDWLSDTIADINYCRNKVLPFAASIHIRWPAAPQAIHFVDTRGYDGFLGAQLRKEIENPASLLVLCSSFEAAPDRATLEALRHASRAGRTHGITILALTSKLSLGISANIDEDEDPDERKAHELAERLKQERLPYSAIVAGHVAIQAPSIVDAITIGVSHLRSKWSAELATHLQVLSEVCRTDCVGILRALRTYQAAHANIIADAPPLAGLPTSEKRVFQFDEMPHSARIAACVRRNGAYENLDARLYVIGPYVNSVAAAAEDICSRLSADCAARKTAAVTPVEAAAAVMVHDRLARFRHEAVPMLTECMTEWLATIFTGPDGDEIFSLCDSAYGPNSFQVRGKERYRQFVIRQIDAWLTDEMNLPPVLAAQANAIWQQATSSLALHADIYAQALPATAS